jgi:hypothetical protein
VSRRVLVQGISVDPDVDPFAASGDDGQNGRSDVRYPHIVLQLGHVLLSGSFLRECPRQHKFGLEHRSTGID